MFLAGRWVPQVVNEALCLSTPKYSGKSGTGNVLSHSVYLIWYTVQLYNKLVCNLKLIMFMLYLL
jgi:hypothetical protein